MCFLCEKRHFKNLCFTKAVCKINEAEVDSSVFLGSVTASRDPWMTTWSRQSEGAIENRFGGADVTIIQEYMFNQAYEGNILKLEIDKKK